ncbi:glycosyltransferase family 4 protein [Shewanella indica]|uniref:glycosyltransferase family 4 protein n=1 Tax=Shewanella indica TaxID=768528 RepID=UPI0039996880
MIVIDNIIFSLQKAGGISIYFSEILNKLIKNNCSFKVLHYENDNYILKEYQQDKLFPVKRSFVPIAITRYVDVFIPKESKVFHSSYYRLPIFFQRRRVKTVTTVHDFTYERYIGGVRAKIHHWQKKRAVLGSDVVVCISNNTKDDLLHYIPSAKGKDIRVVYNGVSDDFFVIDERRTSSPSLNIIFIGSRAGYKNFESIVAAMRMLVDYKLIIIGGGELTHHETSLLEECSAERYHHISFVSNEKLNELYNEAWCLIYPSLYEGFGIPAVEAMKAGCPVIASNTSSLPEICRGAAILLDKVSPELIKRSVLSLKDNCFRERLISNGLKNSKRFSWDKTFQKLNKIYSE